MTSIRQRSLTPSLALSLLFHILLVIAVGLRYQSPNLPRLESYEVDLVYQVPTLQVESPLQKSGQTARFDDSVTTTMPDRESLVTEAPAVLGEGPLDRSEVSDSKEKADEITMDLKAAAKPLAEGMLPLASARESSYDFESLLSELRKRISTSLVYPRMARKRGIQGTVVIRLRLDGNGNLAFLKVIGSSGSDILDRSAQELIKKVLPYHHRVGRTITIEIPIVYRFEK